MNRIGFLFDSSIALSPEERAAWGYLSSLTSVRPARISFQSLTRRPSVHQLPRVLWWHFETSTQLPTAVLSPDVISCVRTFVRNGGSLLLSLLAAQYVVDLGVEELRPNVIRKGTWDEANWAPGYPDIRGFAAFLGHPIFDGLPGGVYTWNPATGDEFCASFDEGGIPIKGSVVAVDRQYIRLNETRRLISEYRFGKGRILTIGTYLFFRNQNHRFRANLERFCSNCISYLSTPGSKAGGKRTYWNFQPRTVSRVEQRGRKQLKTGSVAISSLGEKQVIRRELDTVGGTDQSFDVGGRSILIAGKERGGISEVWCHPVRIVRNLRTAYGVGNAEPQWTDQCSPQFAARPECIRRVYKVADARIEETVFGDRQLPAGAICIRADSAEPVEIVITAAVDLRFMWPLSDTATGSLTYGWDKNLRAFVITAPRANCCALIGASKPPSAQLGGQYSGIEVTRENFRGQPTNDTVVTIALRITLSGGRKDAAIFFAGSHLGRNAAERAFRAIAKHPGHALSKQSEHFRRLDGRRTQIVTGNPEFNEAYSWALASTDRFSAEVPGLGSSLLAGHGTTERGWNGGHLNSGRPGYAWYFGRDSVWTSFALLSCGDFSGVKSVLQFLGSYQDPSGKIPHELTTSGFAHYDAADATPLYIILMGKYLKATGDTAFVRSQFDRLLNAVDFCFSTDTDGDHLIENTNVGHGWVEGGQLFPVHCEHYLASCWAKALEEAAGIATLLHKKALARRWSAESTRVTRLIEKEFWNDQTHFYNFGKLADGSFRAEKTLLPAVGISFGYTAGDRAKTCLEEYASARFSADWGTRIVGNESPLYDPSGYHYGSVWPLFTGWTSLAEFKWRRPVQGFVHVMKNLMSFDRFAAGTIEEVFHGEIFQPAGVCSHQAWSESMAIQPLLDGMMGMEPDATKDRLSLRPYFPPDWKSAACWNIPLGDRRIDISINRSPGCTTFEFRARGGRSVSILFQPYFPLGTRLSGIAANGKRVTSRTRLIRAYEDCPVVEFRLARKTVVEFTHSHGIALVPPVLHPVAMQPSTGIRVIDEAWDNGKYILTLEGKRGRSYSMTLVDPEGTISAAEPAVIREKLNGRVTLHVSFDADGGGPEYQRKTIVCTT